MRLRRTIPALAIAAVVAQPAVATADRGSTTTINGQVPPGVAAKLVDLQTMIDTVGDDGSRLLVMQGIRKPGTRAPIHYHDHGGHTCVLSGTITDFVEGTDPMTFEAGTCYPMPPDTPMTAANLGTEDVRLIATFVLPPAEPSIIVIEPDWPDLTDPTG